MHPPRCKRAPRILDFGWKGGTTTRCIGSPHRDSDWGQFGEYEWNLHIEEGDTDKNLLLPYYLGKQSPCRTKSAAGIWNFEAAG